jgi:hypothetical protein
VNRAITWSYGGGTQSVAIAVLIAQGRLPKPEMIVIADTSREASETWEYLDNHVTPLLGSVGLKVNIAPHSLSYVDLYSNGELLIPAYTKHGMLQTFCSSEWKAKVVQRYLRGGGYGPKKPVLTWIGISLDEKRRAKPSSLQWQKLHWPLLFDVPLRRAECRQIVLDAGLPEPPKSSCWKCPYRRDSQWKRLKDLYPDDFEKACQIDEQIRYEDIMSGGDGLWLHESRKPLREVDFKVTLPVHPLFQDTTGCDSGQCWV